VLDPNDPVVEWAKFGVQVEDFINSPVGQFLVDKARAQINDALEKLQVADPEDPKIIRALQNQACVAESIMQWLGEAIREGQGALNALREEHGE